MSWVQLRLTTSREQAERYSDWLQETGAIAVTLADAEHTPLYEPAPGETPLWPSTEITALYEDSATARQAAAALRRRAPRGELPRLRTETLAEQVWEDAWKRDWAPVDCGHGLWVAPHGVEPGSQATTVIRIEPGLAFGSGAHPTTRLCLQWIAREPMSGCRVIDLGCGSGILGIAALLRGAARVWAVDHEPQALEATRDNAGRNRVGDRLETLASVEGLPKDADVLLANILLNPLRLLAGELGASLTRGGRLVMSGVLGAQVEALWAVYAKDFELTAVDELSGWACVSAVKR